MTHHARWYHRALRLCPETLPSRVRACVAVREQDGRIYFYNAVTQVTQWEAPPDLLSATPAAASAARAPDEWQQTTRSALSFLTRCSVLVCAWGALGFAHWVCRVENAETDAGDAVLTTDAR